MNAASGLEELFTFSPPDGWCPTALPVHINGVAFAPEDVLAAAQGDVRWAGLSWAITELPAIPGQTMHEAVETPMHSRVRQGYPERFSAEIDGRAGLGFDWRDGVRHILSVFVVLPQGRCLELALAADIRFANDLADLARKLWCRVRLEGERAWQVWRQDDNGNRFVVKDGLTRSEANALAIEFEARGHKQTYWIERRSEPPGQQ